METRDRHNQVSTDRETGDEKILIKIKYQQKFYMI